MTKGLPRSDTSARQGFTLTELAIVLTVFSAILGGIWIAASSYNQNKKIETTLADTLQVLSGYRAIYALHDIDNVQKFADVSCLGEKTNIFPTDMPFIGGLDASNQCHVPVNQWGGDFRVYTWKAENMLLISLANIPPKVCINLVANLSQASEVIYQKINTTTNSLPPYGTGTLWSPSNIQNYCNISAGNQVFIGYTVR